MSKPTIMLALFAVFALFATAALAQTCYTNETLVAADCPMTKFEYGFDYDGGDLRQIAVSDYQACAAACCKADDCIAAIWRPQDDINCWFKQTLTARGGDCVEPVSVYGAIAMSFPNGKQQPSCMTSVTAGSYDLRPFNEADVIGISSARTYQYFWRSCSVVSEDLCTRFAPGASLCQLSIPPTSGVVIARPATLEWSFIDKARSGVLGIVQTGDACGSLGLPIQLQILLFCVRSNSSNAFVVTEPTSRSVPICTYYVTAYTSVVCPAEETSAPALDKTVQPESSLGGIINQAKQWVHKQKHTKAPRNIGRN